MVTKVVKPKKNIEMYIFISSVLKYIIPSLYKHSTFQHFLRADCDRLKFGSFFFFLTQQAAIPKRCNLSCKRTGVTHNALGPKISEKRAEQDSQTHEPC